MGILWGGFWDFSCLCCGGIPYPWKTLGKCCGFLGLNIIATIFHRITNAHCGFPWASDFNLYIIFIFHRITNAHGGFPWASDFNHPHYQAGRNAMKRGKKYKYEPSFFGFLGPPPRSYPEPNLTEVFCLIWSDFVGFCWTPSDFFQIWSDSIGFGWTLLDLVGF